MTIRSRYWSSSQVILVFMVMLCELAPASVAWAADEHKRILVLYSTRRDAEFSIVGEDVLPKILDAGLGRDLDYYSEFIDVTRFPDPSYRVAFGDFIRLKYQGIAFDLVIAMGDVAAAFVDSDRVTLLQEAPVVFLANNRDTRVAGNSTGFMIERNFSGTLRVIDQLQPDVKNVFVVTGAAASDRAFERLAREQFTPFESRFAFTYLTGLRTSALEERVATLPEHSVVYYVLVTEDGAGDK
ncbi:MAG TPA: hypothetical protein VIZ32_24880, partial [Vicinamibacterales bacterium]